MRADDTYVKRIKKKAHAVTLASLCWFPFAVAAGFGLTGKDPFGRVISAAVVLLEVGLLVVAVRLWLNEKPQDVVFHKGGD